MVEAVGNALHIREVTDDENDEELGMTEMEKNAVCPISKKEIVKPFVCNFEMKNYKTLLSFLFRPGV